jgi:predicted nucleic acid-binding protein
VHHVVVRRWFAENASAGWDARSLADTDVPAIHGHRQVADVHLLTLARRHGQRLVTFDARMLPHGGAVGDVEVLTSV